MRTIHKYHVKPAAPFIVQLPRGAKFLSVQVQGVGGNPEMWFEVESEAVEEPRKFAVFGTGHAMPADSLRYLGTFQMEGGRLVFHLFECGA